jgi:hypothetical protein
MFKRFADPLMVTLAVFTAAEVLIEEAPQRPEIFSAILAAQKRRPSFVRFSLYRKNPLIKDFSAQILGRTSKKYWLIKVYFPTGYKHRLSKVISSPREVIPG